MKHKEWKSIYLERPEDSSVCVSRIAGEEGYASNTVYDADTATFRTVVNHRNRVEVTIWKHDEWYYA